MKLQPAQALAVDVAVLAAWADAHQEMMLEDLGRYVEFESPVTTLLRSGGR